MKPKLLNFPPYSKDQIVKILSERLAEVNSGGEQVLEPNAIQFCARKVAAVAGDMRKALDVCRRAVEIVENDVKKQKKSICSKQGRSSEGSQSAASSSNITSNFSPA